MEVKKETIVRTVVLVFALLNQTIALLGKEQLPWTDEQVYQGTTAVLTVIASVWSWWKNNSFTHEALQADSVLEELKR